GGELMFRLDKQNRERYTKNIINALYENNKEEFRESYIELHTSDQVDIFITLDKEGREREYMFLEPKEFAVIFSGLYFIHQLRSGGEIMFRLDKQNRERYTKNIINALYENNKEEFRESYIELHPSDQVDIFITLDKEGRERVYMFLEPKEFAVIFSGLYFIHQQVCIEELSDEYSSKMLNNMFTDDTVNFLKRINQEEAKH